ncbi:recombinase family protein [Massilia agri]|uniref:Recombinase family protein n=1 Tax=Massilia agri TaxID=1886785 RepID=A0ABT2AN99_9BURK|nr:recombinase family protein [Massilia agri]MCS0597719.1 recombinase family protein [Massilia agri]
MENVYLYIRYSHEKQEKGSSEDRQMALALSYCPTLINDADHVYFDKGKSAYKGEHLENAGELKRFHDDVKSGKVRPGSTLLVEDLDRLSRADMWKASDFLRELTGAGITVVTLRDRKEYKGTLTFLDAINSLLKQELAHDESKKKGGRVADSFVKRYAAARAGEKVKVLLPGWVEWVSKTKYKLKEPEANTVKEIFTMAAKGWSYAMIAKNLNQRLTPPFRDRGKGKLWIPGTVSALIKSRAVIGEYAPKDGLPPIPNYFPAAITEGLFNDAQGARALRKVTGVTSQSEDRINVWSKVGMCAFCKRPLHCVPKGRHLERYLVCSGKVGGKCNAKNVPATRSEEVFFDVLMNVVKSDYFVGDQSQELSELRALAGQIDTAQVQKQRLEKVLTISDDLEEVVTAIRKVKADIARLTAEKQEKESKLLERETVQRSRASIRAKIDLESRDGRIEANSLLKGLGVIVEIGRGTGGVSYTVYQGEQRAKLLTFHDNGENIWNATYDKDVAVRIHELDDTLWPELSIDRPFGQRKQEVRKPSTGPVPNWNQYDGPFPDNDYEDEYTPTGTDSEA